MGLLPTNSPLPAQLTVRLFCAPFPAARALVRLVEKRYFTGIFVGGEERAAVQQAWQAAGDMVTETAPTPKHQNEAQKHVFTAKKTLEYSPS